MSKKIYVEPSEIWRYFHKNKEELLSTSHEIASNDEFGIGIYITECRNLPYIVVTADDDIVYEEMMLSEGECKKDVGDLYNKYLSDNIVNILADDEDKAFEKFDQEDAVYERESELDEAVYAFLEVACDFSPQDERYLDDDVINDIKEHFLEYIARKWDFDVRRPMYLEDAYGNEFFEEYPYDCLVFEDENNPIYKPIK